MIQLKRRSDPPRFEIKQDGYVVCTFVARHATTEEWLKESALTALMSVNNNETERAEAFAARLENRLGIITGWEDVKDEEDNAVQFSKENMVLLLRQNPSIMADLQHQLFRYFTPEDRVGK